MRIHVLPAALAVLAFLGAFSCGDSDSAEKVVFIDLDTVVSEEKKRIFARVLRGELSREEAEERVGRFFLRFGEILARYEKRGYLVLDAKSVLGGGRDITGEVLDELSARRKADE